MDADVTPVDAMTPLTGVQGTGVQGTASHGLVEGVAVLAPETGVLCGDVVLDPSVAIAPGVLLLADPPARLVIGAGVCIGAGSVIHAWGGVLQVEGGAVLGTATLLVGSGKIGANACIGAMSTVVNPEVCEGQTIASKSYFGEDSIFSGDLTGTKVVTDPDPALHPPSDSHSSIPAAAPPMPSSDSAPSPSFQMANGKPVYGIEAFYRLMAMLFPHRDFSTTPALPPDQTGDPAPDLAQRPEAPGEQL